MVHLSDTAIATMSAWSDITTIASNVMTVLGTTVGLILAWRWLHRRDLERAHDAANNFFDDLHHIVPKVMDFTLNVSHTMAQMASVENDESFLQQKAEIACQCLQLMNRANQVKLLFFARYALVERRGVTIKPEAHKAFEQTLIDFFDAASKSLQRAAATMIPVTAYSDYLQIAGELRLAFVRVQRLSDQLNKAFGEIINVDYRDYFIFPRTIC
jgi:hypothetical protein